MRLKGEIAVVRAGARGIERIVALRRIAEHVRDGAVMESGRRIAGEQPDVFVDELLKLFDQFPVG